MAFYRSALDERKGVMSELLQRHEHESRKSGSHFGAAGLLYVFREERHVLLHESAVGSHPWKRRLLHYFFPPFARTDPYRARSLFFTHIHNSNRLTHSLFRRARFQDLPHTSCLHQLQWSCADTRTVPSPVTTLRYAQGRLLSGAPKRPSCPEVLRRLAGPSLVAVAEFILDIVAVCSGSYAIPVALSRHINTI